MNKMICITGTASKNGIQFFNETFKSEEKDRCYWLNGGSRRVNKDSFMKPYTTWKNDLLTYPKIKYVIWCFQEDEIKARTLLNGELVKVVLLYKQATDTIVNGVFKNISIQNVEK
jgi:hypothetical protein